MLSIENCEKNIKFSHVYIQSLVPVPSLDITYDIQSGRDPRGASSSTESDLQIWGSNIFYFYNVGWSKYIL